MLEVAFTDSDGDFNNSDNSASLYSLLVNPATTTTVSSGGATVYGQSVTYTATLTPSGVGNGTVAFTDNGNAIAGCGSQAVSSSTATCVTTPATVGTHTIVGTYSGSATFGGSTSPNYTQTVNKANTTTGVTPTSPPAIVSGQTVSYTANVAAMSPGAGTPTGTVTFRANSVIISTCTNLPISGGSAMCTTNSLLAYTSPVSVSANYNGDSNFLGSGPTTVTQVVNPAATTTVVGSSSSSVLINHPVTYTATMTGSAPGSGHPSDGTVAFFDGGTAIAACSTQALTNGVASCTQTYPSGGTHTITATYSGDNGYLGSTSSGFTETVTTALPPTAPLNLVTTVAGAGDGTVNLKWSAPASSGTSALKGYDIYIGTTAGHEFPVALNSVPVKGTQASITGLKDGVRYYFVVKAVNAVGTSPGSNEASAIPRAGILLAGGTGAVYAFGSAPFDGSVAGTPLKAPIVGIARIPDPGYWLVASDGGVFAFGDAHFYGSLGGLTLKKPIVGIAATPDGRGYWLVASDGGLFAFGDARYFGSLGNMTLNKPIVGMAPTVDGRGYWLVASDGGLFTFGDAHYFGSLGNRTLTKPIVGMTASPDGGGYWMVASDGGVFTFGDATYFGSLGAIHLVQPIVAMVATSDGGGYWLVAADGGVFAFGDARFLGSVAGVGHVISAA